MGVCGRGYCCVFGVCGWSDDIYDVSVRVDVSDFKEVVVLF